MKNLFFSLAFMLIGSIGFANEIANTNITKESNLMFNFAQARFVDMLGTCYVTVSFYNSDGELTGTRLHTFYNVSSQEECDRWATSVRLLYISAG